MINASNGGGRHTPLPYILMLSVHGLVRGRHPELGRDPDTGGQVHYVLELARALGRRPDVARVDLLTRLIEDPDVSSDYAVPIEPLGDKARIVRLPFGPKGYLRKEALWDYLDALVDRCLHFVRSQGSIPDIVHSHYADAGYVATHLSRLLGIPQIHTGHSLGRIKRERLIASGKDPLQLEEQYNFERRIAAEEETLGHARLIVASTRHEVEHQYAEYERFDARRCAVIPPGVDVSRFRPQPPRAAAESMRNTLERFLRDPHKPSILAIARPVESKNLELLIDAFGRDERLRQRANLIILAGNREDVESLEPQAREVIERLIAATDRHDLYGIAALPKRHVGDDVPEIMRYVARWHGVFVNPAANEPFGLTLIEAAAAGLPVVAVAGGGPRDIVANCRNGVLVPEPTEAYLAAALEYALDDARRWRRWSRNGQVNVARHYTWEGHVAKYLKNVERVRRRGRKSQRRGLPASIRQSGTALPLVVRALISDLDYTLTGDTDSLRELVAWLRRDRERTAFGVATGRTFENAIAALKEAEIPVPDVLIAGVGSGIYYGPNLDEDLGWRNYIAHEWRRDDLARLLSGVDGLTLQVKANQAPFKLSYVVDPQKMPPLDVLNTMLDRNGLRANLVYSSERFLDVLPQRASKGTAIRYLAYKWGLPLENFLVAGDSGNDIEMFRGDSLGVVVANHTAEMAALRGRSHVYFASSPHAAGILEALAYYGFDSVGEVSAAGAPAVGAAPSAYTEDGTARQDNGRDLVAPGWK